MNIRKILLCVTLFLTLSSPISAVASTADKEQLYASFTSPEGIHFESYSSLWDRNKLEELYQSFMKNAHGEELSILSTIKLAPEEPQDRDGDCDVEYSFDNNQHIFIPSNRTITLYYANEFKDVTDVSYTLSHEYGHIFTYYWLAKKENIIPEVASHNQWANIRGIKQYPIRWNYWDNNNYNHFWQPEEIMANDYVQLFGSPDAKEKLFWTPDMAISDSSYINNIENNVIPAAESVPGLRQYWENLSGIHTNPLIQLLEPSIISLQVVNKDENSKKPGYIVTFTPATKGNKDNVEYFVRWSTQSQPETNEGDFLSKDSEMHPGVNKIVLGVLPKEKLFLRVYAFNPTTKQLTYSPMYWYDFSNPMNPKPIPNQFKIN